MASLATEHGLYGVRASVAVVHNLSRCSSKTLDGELRSQGTWA